jgi:outer membrane receptor for monomeric catechols
MFAAAGHGENIDVAQSPVSLWSALRNVPAKAFVAGKTRWGDFIAIRGQLESNGLCVRNCKQQGQLIDWALR